MGTISGGSQKRWAANFLLFWALAICGFLGLFLALVIDSIAELDVIEGYEPYIGMILLSWTTLGFLRVAAFWMLRRATFAPDPFFVALLSMVPPVSLIIGPTVILNAANDLEERGQPTGIHATGILAFALPYVFGAIFWLGTAPVIAFVPEGFHSVALVMGLLGFVVIPALCRLYVALKLRGALVAWDLTSTNANARARHLAPVAF